MRLSTHHYSTRLHVSLYLISRDQIALRGVELWDGETLKCSFGRCVDTRLYNLWEEVVSLAFTLELFEEDDELICQFYSSGVYSS
jgi:hypothetical protein